MAKTKPMACLRLWSVISNTLKQRTNTVRWVQKSYYIFKGATEHMKRDINILLTEKEIIKHADEQMERIKKQVSTGRVILGLSGGVDSSVCGALLAKALPNQVVLVFVDHGFMRKNEGDRIEAAFKNTNTKFLRVNAQERFLKVLNDITDPEEKRKIIGTEFIRVFEEEARKLENIDFFAQGTIYLDLLETDNHIKSHHNVALPDIIEFKGIIEPISYLLKEEVRILGRYLGLDKSLTERQPFPGPGLAVRVMGSLTKEKLDILREADAIFTEEIEKNNCKCQEYFAILTNIKTTGVLNGKRKYEYAVALRAVLADNPNDFPAICKPADLSYNFLDFVSKRITNEVKGIGRVLYDITSKPPATVEWE